MRAAERNGKIMGVLLYFPVTKSNDQNGGRFSFPQRVNEYFLLVFG